MDSQSRRILLRVLVMSGLGTLVLGLTGLALVRLSSEAPLGELLAQARPGWLALAVLGNLIGTGLHGARMRALIPAEHRAEAPGLMSLGSLYIAATVLNLSFPGPAGELAVALVLRRTHGLPAVAVLAASLHARFVSVLISALVVVCFLPILEIPESLRVIAWTGSALLAAAGLVLGLLSFRPTLLAAIAERTVGEASRRLKGPAQKVASKIHEQVLGFAHYLGAIPRQGMRAYAVASGWSLGTCAAFFGTIWCAAAAFGITPGAAGTFFTQSLALIASVALVVFPGGLGAFDLTLTGSLVATAGVTVAQGGLILLGVRIAQLLSMATSGLAFMYWARHLLSVEVVEGIEAGMTELNAEPADAPSPPLP